MDFPISDLLDEDACYAYLVAVIHPCGLTCPRCGSDDLRVHRRTRAPILDYRCPRCKRVFNAFTRTALHKTQYRPSQMVLILRGIAQNQSTAAMARELGISRPHLLKLRHRLQNNAWFHRDTGPLDDNQAEADEMFQNAGEKGIPHPDPADPPRRRGNKRRGRGGWDGDRPPVCGTSGRRSGQLRLRVERRIDGVTLEKVVETATWGGTTIYTDECSAYNGLPAMGRPRQAVRHSEYEWARDDDGDGIREVHCNTLEGIWTGLRNFLRPFRGVNKTYLAQYAAIFAWGYNVKRAVPRFLRAMLDPAPRSILRT